MSDIFSETQLHALTLENSTSVKKFFTNILTLLAHPLQRPEQGNLRIPRFADASLQKSQK